MICLSMSLPTLELGFPLALRGFDIADTIADVLARKRSAKVRARENTASIIDASLCTHVR